jgi:hypothetical protein
MQRIEQAAKCRGRVQDRSALLAVPDWRAGRVLTVECPDEYTVLTAVARRGADVGSIVHAPVLGRPWGARGGGERVMPGR